MLKRWRRKVWNQKNPRMRPGAYAGNAGMVATVAVAFAGLLAGAVAAYVSERGVSASAYSTGYSEKKAPNSVLAMDRKAEAARAEVVAGILSGERPPERLIAPSNFMKLQPEAVLPKIILIMDDMGVDKRMTERAIALPGPITYSFLPYARNVSSMVETARLAGGEIMLHLPMEPRGDADPGPYALRTRMTGGAFIDNLEWNLSRFDGYVGVNNHMGSKLTSDVAAMKTLIAYLNREGLFFLDSLTTNKTMVRAAARQIGVDVYSRDVFLDDAVGNVESIKTQLALAERIARETGYVVVIGHPRKETLDILGPWLASAPVRGMELAFASELPGIIASTQPATMAQAPSLRF
ncbi:divergent polysaccharide deacetylase family protein [Hyphococcus flavus]|uniref:Divergent polysaccharide deacetylase family protein n=1 Tax=Hyphococcus flavus TaxID=1866326 RepID=A0AAF0CGT6_9PROT|nr:divergent polysaccharide deacetylase family protein [Hyphococcus flavus]WDI31092.1 divergent polysaccharide deacetylase family protein [Hyphococcus flavus]